MPELVSASNKDYEAKLKRQVKARQFDAATDVDSIVSYNVNVGTVEEPMIIRLADGDWIVTEGGSTQVMSDTEFKSQYSEKP